MDQSNENSKSCRKAISLLQGDEVFFNKLISRDSSLGLSSRFYFRAPNGIPFKWELHPGTPIRPCATTADLLPPLSPPPAALAPQSFGGVANRRSSNLIAKIIWFWNKKKRSNLKTSQQRMEHGIEAGRIRPWRFGALMGPNQLQRLEIWGALHLPLVLLIVVIHQGGEVARGKRVQVLGLNWFRVAVHGVWVEFWPV
ncbi:hypothetical protein Sjap_010629 [Stephania japonica]|uniref:Uncharacterized protein n=1 Tax=Stephania japonica TaxID=461633 RepID=A0AAP0JBZ8_9MAGN